MNQAFINPSYDNSLPPERRLYDFLGKYYINLNGVVPNNNLEITEPHKKEIVDFALEVIQKEIQTAREGEREKLRKIFLKFGISNDEAIWQSSCMEDGKDRELLTYIFQNLLKNKQ